MNDRRLNQVKSYFQRSNEVLLLTLSDDHCLRVIVTIADRIVHALRGQSKLLIAGNGGSAADAQHIAAEFVCRFRFDRPPLSALALTTDTSVLTAIGNDYIFDNVFERQVRGLGRRGDIFLAISTSGRSPNIITALKAAREIGIVTIGFTGQRRQEMEPLCDLMLTVPTEETALVQQIYMIAAHAICSMVEEELFGMQTRRV